MTKKEAEETPIDQAVSFRGETWFKRGMKKDESNATVMKLSRSPNGRTCAYAKPQSVKLADS